MNDKGHIFTDINQITKEKYPIDYEYTAFECLKNTKYLNTGLDDLDDLLKGGIPNYGITEIFGKSSSGKTQFSLQLCLQCQLPLSQGGFGKDAIYITTNQPFPYERLLEMANYFVQKHESQIENWEGELDAQALCSRVYTIHANSLVKQDHVINDLLPEFLNRNSIGLIVIDSVASNFKEIDNPSEKTQHIKSLVRTLRELGKEHQIAIICINQITDVIGNDENSDGEWNYDSDDSTLSSKPKNSEFYNEFNPLRTNLYDQLYAPLKINFTPALGLTWSSQVNTRILVHRLLHQNKRKAVFINSSIENSKGVYFTIESEGLVQTE